MRITRISEFISKEEQNTILEWFVINQNDTSIFKPAYNRGEDTYPLRLSTRRVSTATFPKVVEDLYSRIKKTFSFTEGCHCEVSDTNHGIIAVITFKGGDTFSHKDTDSNCGDVLSVIRFNILIQSAEEGGVLWIKDESGESICVSPEERELHAYNVSDYYHAVSEVKSDKPRFILLFSMCCPREHWDSSLIKINP